MKHRTLVTLSLLGLSLAPGVASAAGGDAAKINGVRFDVHADVGGYASIGAGLRVDIPIVRDGLIADANDELALSPGVDLFFANFYDDYYNGGPYLIPGLVLQWNFYLPSGWSVFPEAGIALFVGDGDYLRRGRGVYAAPNLGFGVRYHITPRTALLARVSTPTGLQLGVTF